VIGRIQADVNDESLETGMSGIVGGGEVDLQAKDLLAGPHDVAAKRGIPGLPRESIEAEGTVAHHEGIGAVGTQAESEDLRVVVAQVDDLGGSGGVVTAVAPVGHRLDALDDDARTIVAAVVGAATAPKRSTVTAGERDTERGRSVL